MRVDLKAPKGKFRVVGVDTFSSENWVQGDFDKKEDAIDEADKRGASMLKMHVYDEQGSHLHESGKF